jgi:hypothetical protein
MLKHPDMTGTESHMNYDMNARFIIQMNLINPPTLIISYIL